MLAPPPPPRDTLGDVGSWASIIGLALTLLGLYWTFRNWQAIRRIEAGYARDLGVTTAIAKARRELHQYDTSMARLQEQAPLDVYEGKKLLTGLLMQVRDVATKANLTLGNQLSAIQIRVDSSTGSQRKAHLEARDQMAAILIQAENTVEGVKRS